MFSRLVILTLATLLPFSISSATTWVVNPAGTGDFPTIQAAVNAAANGDVIELTDGVFVGNNNKNIDYSGKAITVRSQSGDPESCVIDCQGLGRGFSFQSNEGLSSRVEGIGITNGNHLDSGGIRCANSSPTISGCVISASSGAATFRGGVYFFQSDAILEGCVIRENPLGGGSFGAGVFLDSESGVTLRDCLVVDNEANGIVCFRSSPEITGCTISGNTGTGVRIFTFSHPSIENTIISFQDDTGAECFSSSSITIACSDVFGNTEGDWIQCIADQAGVNGNFSLNPLFCNPSQGVYTLQSDSPCAPPGVTGCGLVGALDVGCGPISLETRTWGVIKGFYRE
jgi:parallel beta-helix repeat protein